MALWPILLWACAGCALPNGETSTSFWRQRTNANPVDGAHAVLEVALIERPVGDAYINRDLWAHVDEMVVDLEQRSALSENGLRVGQLVGTPPNAFQALLLSKRSCSNPHALLIPPGKTVPLYLGPVLAHTSFEVAQAKLKTTVDLDQARFCFDITPSLTADGRTKFTFAPRVENGEPTLPFQPAADDSGWTLRIERPSRRYPDLGWEVTLGPNQVLIIGARPEHERSLGQRAFVQDEGEPVQRLLVLRNGRAPGALGDVGIEAYLDSQCPPLALQATLPIVRAKGR
jgi:hypothetical protein